MRRAAGGAASNIPSNLWDPFFPRLQALAKCVLSLRDVEREADYSTATNSIWLRAA